MSVNLMTPEKPAADVQKRSSLWFDVGLIFCFFVFLTGADPFITDKVRELVGRKPWIHRGVMAAVAGFGVILFAWVQSEAQKGRREPSVFVRILSSINISAHAWTWIVFLVSAGTWTVASFMRHEVFNSGFDMAIFVQAVWNTLHGHFLYSSVKGGICLLGDHFSPLLALLALPYAVWPDPKCLLLMQSLAAASCVFPLFLIAENKLPNKSPLPLCFVLSFVLYLPLRNSVRFDFHPEILVMPLLLWVFYFLEKGEGLKSSGLIALSFLAKENVALVAFGLGLYGFLFARERIFGLFWMLISPLYLIAMMRWVIPFFSGQEYFYVKGSLLSAGTLERVMRPASVIYLFKVLAPVGFLSFLSPPAFLLTLPMLVQNFTIPNEAVRSIFFQYTVFLTPFIFISAIYGATKLSTKRWLPFYVLTAALLMSGISDYYIGRVFAAKQNAHIDMIKNYLKTIPFDASVRTHEMFAPHAAHRMQLHIYENNHPREGGAPVALASEYVVLDRSLLQNADADFEKLIQTGYQVIHDQDGFKVFKRT